MGILSISTHRCLTLFRPKSEYEILQIGLQINENLKNILEMAGSNITEKIELFERKALRQRQRVTFLRMVSAIPSLIESIVNTCTILHQIIININNLFDSDLVAELKKKLKLILKY